MQGISDQIEGIPGFNIVNDIWNDYAGNKFNTKDPYYVTLPDGKTKRRQPPNTLGKRDRKIWKRIVKKAWFHDRCFLNMRFLDIGLGICPIVNLIPVIGPTFMWAVHGRIMRIADDLHVPASIQAKMSANILFDFVCSLIPVMGAIFAWINACSTRNAALVDTYLRQREMELDAQAGPFERVNDEPSKRERKEQKKQLKKSGGPVSGRYNRENVGQQESGYL